MELVAQRAAAHQEAAAARAKASADVEVLERLHGERSQLAGAVDELCGELELAGQEHDAAVRLSEEQEEQVRAAQGNLASKILLLFPSDRQFVGRGMFN
jgi:hypothetical protein